MASSTHVAPHLAREAQKQQALDMLQGKELPAPDAPAQDAPVAADAPIAAPAPAQDAPVADAPAQDAPVAPAPAQEYVPVSEFQRLAEEHRLLRRKILEERPPAEVPDQMAAEAKRAIEQRDYDALKRMGLTLNEWADAELKDNEDPTGAAVRNVTRQVQELQQQLAATREELQRREQAAQEQAQRQAYADTMTDIQQALDGDPELRLLSLAGREKDVYNVIAQYAAHTLQTEGQAKYLPPEQAARYVLQREAQRLEALFQHAKQLPQYQQYFATPAAQPAAQQPAAPPVPGVQVAPQQLSGSEPPRTLTREERREALIQQLVAAQHRQG